MMTGQEAMIDRWSVSIEPSSAKHHPKHAKSIPLGNYLGVGVDGQVYETTSLSSIYTDHTYHDYEHV